MSKSIKYDIKNIIFHTPYLMVVTCLVLYVFVMTVSILNVKDSSFIGPYYLSSFIVNMNITPALNAFLLLMPLVCSLFVGKYMIDESKSRVIVLSRISKRKYLGSKLIVSFVLGFIMLFIVLLLSILFFVIIVPKEVDYFYTGSVLSIYSSRINDYVWLLELYLLHPFVYMMLYVSIIAFFSGLYCQMTVMLSLFIHNKIIIYVFCFFVVALSNYFMIIPSINSILMPSIQLTSTRTLTPVLLVVYALVFIIPIIYLSLKYLRKDDF